ncbi:MAG: TonB-dependent receptor [Gemmatimonadota bacterium]|nr:TonB-dependent receptor [Gemmatimonadota bacterium]
MERTRRSSAYTIFLGALALSAGNAAAQERSAESAAALSLDSLLSIPVSSAAKSQQDVKEAPASVTIVTADEIARFDYQTIAEVLENQRGVYGSYDRISNRVGVRGFSRSTEVNSRVLLLIDGERLNDGFFGSAPTGTDFGIDLSIVDRIEIVRGPGSAVHGSNAMFMVVNVITQSGADLEGFQIKAGASSFGGRGGTVNFGQRFGTDVDVLVSGSWQQADGPDVFISEYQTPAFNMGLAEDRDWLEGFGALAKVRIGDLTLLGLAQTRDKGIATGAFGSLFNHPDNHVENHRYLASAKYERELGRSTHLAVRLAYDQGDIFTGLAFDDPILPALNFRSRGGRATVEARLRWDLAPSNRLVIGTEYQNLVDSKSSITTGDVEPIPREDRYWVTAVYVQDEWQATEKLAFVAGARLDQHSTVGTQVTPRAAVVFHPSEPAALKLLYGDAFRSPSNFELFIGEPGILMSNPALRPERIRTVELVWEHRWTDFLFGTASAFDYRVEGLIDRLADESSGIAKYDNLGRVTARGVEAELTARFRSGVGGSASWSHQRVTEHGHDEGGADVQDGFTNSPANLVRAAGWTPLGAELRLAAQFRFESGRRTRTGVSTDPSSVVDLTLSTRQLFGRVRGAVSIRNLFDETVEHPTGLTVVPETIVQDGRSLRLTLLLSF